ncbi:class I SAM-dependent methyltransferase [Streptomyces sp. ST2-7A]|uniref:class I SAM-dependent methyltransferase n=1 Tax=Streptomyces sp. ST2-7A TaxID=2907214 RepID=UPI001F29A658|nr:class I SAM-dependent methyltransferase [Streptomyces sp. ST2-7A]MCE7080235.1 class I SAM-dependent methyltransferase [Streptomyces sp. ST2-7A]
MTGDTATDGNGRGVGGTARSRSGNRPTGTVTRGTTHRNRLRRMDRWIVAEHGAALRRSPHPPLAVDLGYGAAPWTAVELAGRLRAVRPDVRLVGLEIDPARVAAAQPFATPGLAFRRGGFEVPPGGGDDPTDPADRPLLIRAANVLRQYPEEEVPAAWRLMCGRLAPDGLLVEGTCDEIGRRHAWVALGPEGPRTLTLAARLADLGTPGDLAERLPKALIHRNVPGEPVHAWLRDLDRAWAAAAPFGALGARQRWLRTVRSVAADWPVRGGHTRHRQGEVTVDWSAVAPR